MGISEYTVIIDVNLCYCIHSLVSIKLRFSDTRREKEKLLKPGILSPLDRRETSKIHLCLTLNSLAVSLRTIRFNVKKFYMVHALR